MITYDPDSHGVTDALLQWRGRAPFPTDMGSASLRALGRQVTERAVFAARATNALFVQELQDVVDRMLTGEINMATGRWELMKLLKQLGYDPETGFPGDVAKVPPAQRGSLRDLSSRRRLDLMLETNLRMAANYGLMIQGHTAYALHAYPAWQLVRIYSREIPRGAEGSGSIGWERRWSDAGAAVGWEGAFQGRLVALKTSPIWEALGSGAGGHDDAIGNPYPPFAFQSGMGWRQVSRAELEGMGPMGRMGPMQGAAVAPVREFSPGEQEVRDVVSRLSPELREALKKELEVAAA